MEMKFFNFPKGSGQQTLISIKVNLLVDFY